MYKKKILVIDETIQVLEMLRWYLAKEGFLVFTAADAWRGLALVYVEEPDLVVTAINMQDFEGIELIKQLRLLAGKREFPIIALSGPGQPTIEDAVKAGATRAFSMPLRPHVLVGYINELLGGYAAA